MVMAGAKHGEEKDIVGQRDVNRKKSHHALGSIIRLVQKIEIASSCMQL